MSSTIDAGKEKKVNKIHEELFHCLSALEKEIEKYDRTKTKQLNEICMLSAQIAELTDHMEKARLKENELTERVARWVEYLKEEKEKMLQRGSRLCATGVLSAFISEDIEYNISKLVSTRQRVDEKLAETKRRKKEHKAQLKQLKGEMLLLHRELKEWDRKYDELAEAMKRMEIARERLHERIKEQRQRTSAARLVCADLDRKLHELCGSDTSAKHNYCHSHGLKSQFSTVTTSSSRERTTFVEEITLPPS